MGKQFCWFARAKCRKNHIYFLKANQLQVNKVDHTKGLKLEKGLKQKKIANRGAAFKKKLCIFWVEMMIYKLFNTYHPLFNCFQVECVLSPPAGN